MSVEVLSDADFLRRINQMGFCRYDHERGGIEIIREVHTDEFYYGSIYRNLVKFLTLYAPKGELFNYPKASEVKLSFYSGCLLRYVFDLLDNGLEHADTCWYKKCENSRLIGYVGENTQFDIEYELSRSTLKDSDRLLSRYKRLTPSLFTVEEGWLKYTDPDINRIILNLSEKVRLAIRIVLRGSQDRSLSLISGICEQGFDEKAAYRVKQGVFGFSTDSQDYSVFHGKHRVVALMYLVSKGVFPPHFEIKYPTVFYPFKHFGNSSGKKCDRCGML